MPNSNPACTEPPVAEDCTGITTPGSIWIHLPDIPWQIPMLYTSWLLGWTDAGISWELKCISGVWKLKYNGGPWPAYPEVAATSGTITTTLVFPANAGWPSGITITEDP